MRSPEQQTVHMLNQGLAALNQRNTVAAENNFEQVLKANPNEPNALFLLGATRKLQGKLEEAVALMKQALLQHSNPAQIHNSLGNIYRESGKLEEAVTAYKKAVKLTHNYAEAYFNAGLALHALGNYNEAIQEFDTAISHQPQNPAPYNALGASYKAAGRVDKAESVFKKAIELRPDYYKAHHNLGALLRDQDRDAEAIQHLARAVELAPSVIEPHFIMANIYKDQGNFEKADKAYRTVLSLQPDFVEAHQLLNKLYWEHGKTGDYGKSYIAGIKACPQSVSLCQHHLADLESAGRTEEAIAYASEYLSLFPDNAELHRRSARLQVLRGSADTAYDSYLRAIDLEPDNPDFRLDASKNMIQMGEYKQALKHLEFAERFSPNNQRMWAYRSLCWLMEDDERHEWLNNYDVLVTTAMIEAPQGYSRLSDFLADLKETLSKYHTSKYAPIDQTLRGGSQTHGTLFSHQDPAIKQLQHALRKPIETCLRSLPADSQHPYCRRNSGSFDFSASWSVWLNGGGFHVNHIHTLGWTSSAFYVDVPTNNVQQHKERQGWIKFGESALSLGERDIPRHFIEPKPGLLALFPSYMWHGTVAFEGTDDRVTAPFDIVPA